MPERPHERHDVTPTGDSEAGFSLISDHSREASAGKLADVVGPKREDNGRGTSNAASDASANCGLRALIAQARQLLYERQVEQALAVSDRLLRLAESVAEPASLEAAALLEHARSLMYLDYRDSHYRRWIRPAAAIYCRFQRFSPRARRTTISNARSSGVSNAWRRLRGELSGEQHRYEQATAVLQRVIDVLAVDPGDDSVLLAQAHFLHLQADGMLGAPVRLSDVRGSTAGPETDLALERRLPQFGAGAGLETRLGLSGPSYTGHSFPRTTPTSPNVVTGSPGSSTLTKTHRSDPSDLSWAP